jgi:prepilin peptidase CpaA
MTRWIWILRHCLFFALLIGCLYTDLTRGKIYNWCTLPAVFVGLLLAYVLGGLSEGGWLGVSLASSIGGMAVVGLVFAWPYFRGGIAAGDVKLMLAVGAFGGLQEFFCLYALLYTALVGALMAVLMLIWRKKLREGLKGAFRFTFSTHRLEGEADDPGHEVSGVVVPYGFAITIGSAIAWYTSVVPAQGIPGGW